MDLEQFCDERRKLILDIEKDVRLIKQQPMDPVKGGAESADEMRANLMLCIRHLEDARMRLGKVIQAKNGGISCYDKPKSYGIREVIP